MYVFLKAQSPTKIRLNITVNEMRIFVLMNYRRQVATIKKELNKKKKRRHEQGVLIVNMRLHPDFTYAFSNKRINYQLICKNKRKKEQFSISIIFHDEINLIDNFLDNSKCNHTLLCSHH